MGEQMRRLDRAGIPYTVTPGVPAFAAAAAALKRELTLPEIAQSVVLTRTGGRASAMPTRETLAAFAATGATMAIHLSIHALERVTLPELIPHYGEDCPAAVVAFASWPQERIVTATLGTIAARAGRRPGRAHRADPRRPRAGGGRFSRERPLRCRLRQALPRVTIPDRIHEASSSRRRARVAARRSCRSA